MTVERWLTGILYRDATKRKLKFRYDEQLAKCAKTGAMVSDDRVQTSKNLHQHEDNWVKLAMIGEELAEVDRMAEKAYKIFKKLSTIDLTLVMELRYIDRLSVDDICTIMEFESDTSYRRRHKKAIEELEHLL
jgi:hypothetical protein